MQTLPALPQRLKRVKIACPKCQGRRLVTRTHAAKCARDKVVPLCRTCDGAKRAAENQQAREAAAFVLCRHCKKGNVCRARGLCWSCSLKPAVRPLYPSTSKYARRGVGNVNTNDLPLPSFPTTAPPGSPEKVAVMEARAGAKVQIWHPHDAREPGDPRPLVFLAAQARAAA